MKIIAALTAALFGSAAAFAPAAQNSVSLESLNITEYTHHE